MERDHGRIVSVSTRTLGSVLDGDHAASATSLVLFDAGDFDETGGTLNINGATLAYASVDDDAATITLTDPLPADAVDGDFVACWDTLYDTASTVKTAMVQVDGDDDNPDPIECTVPHFLADKLAEGDRGGPGESVTIGYDEDEDEWQILDVRGLAGASGAGVKFEADDSYILTAADITAGTATFPLSHQPITESLVAFWRRVPQEPTEYTIDYEAQTVTWPLTGFEQAGDRIWVHYAYRSGIITPSASARVSTTVPVDGTPGGQNGATVTGAGAVLADGTDTTYISLPGGTAGQMSSYYQGISNWSASGKANIVIEARIKTNIPGGSLPLMNLTEAGYGTWAGYIQNSDHPVATVDPDGWLRVDLPIFDHGGLAFLDSSYLTLNNVNTNVGGQVYEAEFVVSWDA